MIFQPTPREIIHLFFRRKFTFLLIASGVLLAGFAYLMTATPLYQSQAALVVRFGGTSVPNIDRTRAPQPELAPNQRREILFSDAAILHSPDVARTVIDKFGIARIYPKLAANPPKKGSLMDEALRLFNQDLLVDVGQQSDVITLYFMNPDPKLAQLVTQALIDEYMKREANVYANPQIEFAYNEEQKAAGQLTDAQKTLEKFKLQNGVANFQQQVSQLLIQKADTETRLQQVQARVAEASQRQEVLQGLLTKLSPTVTSSAAGEQYHAVDTVQGELAQLRAQRDAMAGTYQQHSPVFDKLNAQINSLERDLKQQDKALHSRSQTAPNVVFQNIQTDYLRAKAEADSARQPESVLEDQLKQINTRLNDLEGKRSAYDELVRKVQVAEDTYTALATRYQEARVANNRNSDKISSTAVITDPVLPDRPARPRKKITALATLFAALVLGTGGVLLAEAADNRFSSPQQVSSVLRLPVLATFGRDI